MTNDEIRKRAEQVVMNWRQDSDASETTRLINYVHSAMFLAVTTALEEAAKVADERAEKRAKQVTVAGQAGDYAMESLAIARGSEAESIRDAIRALIPSTGTKE